MISSHLGLEFEMLVKIKRIEIDSGMVMGSYNPEKDSYDTFDRPQAIKNFLHRVIEDIMAPNANHRCSNACHEPVTLVLGSPFQEDLEAAAPP